MKAAGTSPEKFKALLDEQVSWPEFYDFKFITKTDSLHQLEVNLTDCNLSRKESKNGKYTSITARKFMNSSEEVVAVYQKMSKIEGVITL